MVVFDATILVLLLDPDARPPNDPETGEPVIRCKERLEHLIAEFERERTRVIIPTPVLSEVLVRAGDAGPAYLDELSGSARFKVAPFDTRAAVELAALTREALDAGDKKEGSTASWAKVKFDRQIVAIARTEGAGRGSSTPMMMTYAASRVPRASKSLASPNFRYHPKTPRATYPWAPKRTNRTRPLPDRLWMATDARTRQHADYEQPRDRCMAVWRTMFGDTVVATAILDRLDSHVVTIRVDSYRLREKRRSGLIKPAAEPR